MRWLPTSVPPSAAALLTTARAGLGGPKCGYSRAQEFVAALHAYAALPVEARLALARAYGAHLAGEAEGTAAPSPRPAAGKVPARLKAKAGEPAALD
jgi:hypothetical protein